MSGDEGWELQGAALPLQQCVGLSRKDRGEKGEKGGKQGGEGKQETRQYQRVLLLQRQDASGCIPCSSLIFSWLK